MSRQHLERFQRLLPVIVLLVGLLIVAVAYAATH